VRLLAIARQWKRSNDGRRALLADLEQLERDGTGDRLREIAEGLTAAERERFRAEVASGDPLATLVAAAVLVTPPEGPVVLRCVCGGVSWRPEPDGSAEWCVACGARSPVSVGGAEFGEVHRDRGGVGSYCRGNKREKPPEDGNIPF